MIYLLRHGQTVWNRIGRLQGQQDSPLTLRGIAQARALGGLLKETLAGAAGPRPRIVSSPLGRAWQTAVIVAGNLGLDPADIVHEPRLAEIAFGAWEGHSETEIAERFAEAWAKRQADKWNFVVPGGESYALVAARVGAWLAELEAAAPLVVVSHGGTGRILRGLYLQAAPQEIFAMDEPQEGFFRLSQGVITRFDISPDAV